MATRSDVACRRFDVVALFELCKPRIRLIRGHMQPGGAVLFPGLERVMAECLAFFFAIRVLG